MKKNISKICALIVLGLLFITGCDTKENNVEIAKKNMQELKSYKMKASLIVGIKQSGVSIELPINMDSIVDNENKKSKMIVNMEFMGDKKEVINYIDSNDETAIIKYSSNDNKNWKKSITTNDDISSSLINENDLVEVKSDDKDCYLYEAKITKEKLFELLQSDENNYFSQNIASNNVNFNDDVIFKYYINKKTKYVEKIIADLKDVAIITDESTDQKIELTKLYFKIEYLDFNDVEEIVIPDEILNAVEANTMNCKYSSTKSGMDMDFSYDVTYEGDYVINIKSIERVTIENPTILDSFKKQVEESYSPYENIDYYFYNVEVDGNSVITTVDIDYSKIDIDEMIEIAPVNSQFLKDGKIELSVVENLYKSMGATCTR